MNSNINLKTILIFFLILLFSKNSISDECLTKKELNIGLIENSYIDYKYYLYYTLGEYSSENNIVFNISEVNNNLDEFDIIFGEFRDLEKFSSNQLIVPDKILKFYKNNEIEISGNLFPLDLDTFILLSKEKFQKLTFEEFSKLYNPAKYTLGMSIQEKKNIINLLIYHLEKPYIDLDSLSFELVINLFIKTYKNLNKNILDNNFLEVYNSFENSENIYTLFSDGILLSKNTDFESFQLFPKGKYKWSDKEGIFIENLNVNPSSFYGFSAHLNNPQSSGFLCYLIEEEVRLKAFKDFNIQLSPLSIYEVRKIEDELPENYISILEKKNKNIFNPNYLLENQNYDFYSKVFVGKQETDFIFGKLDYLNK